MKKYKVVRSDIKDVDKAVDHIARQLSGIDAGLVLYFASPVYPADRVSKKMSDAFPGIPTVGCTTAGEMITNEMGQDSMVAMAWQKDTLKFLKTEVLQNIKTDHQAVEKAFKGFEDSLGGSMKNLDPSRYVGLVMIDGLSGCEEMINDRIGNLTNIPFVGGSAGDNFMFQNTYLFADGKTYTDAAVLVLMEPAEGFAILKTQSFVMTDKKLTPTKVDEKRRMVIEFNHKPATEAYAEILGISVNDLAEHLGEYPVGLVFDENNYFVRSPQQIEGTSIIFYCSIKEGLELTILRSRDIVGDTRKDLEKAEKTLGKVNAVVDFNCCLRTLELGKEGKLKAYSDIFHPVPAIGFATYGESYIGHINQTSTMLLLK